MILAAEQNYKRDLIVSEIKVKAPKNNSFHFCRRSCNKMFKVIQNIDPKKDTQQNDILVITIKETKFI